MNALGRHSERPHRLGDVRLRYVLPAGVDGEAGACLGIPALTALHAVLMDGDEPAGGQWNFDAENRKSFPASGPQGVPAPLLFQPLWQVVKPLLGKYASLVQFVSADEAAGYFAAPGALDAQVAQ